MHQTNDNSSREFLLKSAALGAGAVIGGTRTLGAETLTATGNGPYPTDGMAGSSETAPLTLVHRNRSDLSVVYGT